MSNQENMNKTFPDNRERPVALTVLCVLTFIGSGFSAISFLMIYFSFEEVQPLMNELSNRLPGMELLANAGKNFFLTGFILYFFSLTGARLMWNLRKTGFHFYTASQIALVLLPFVYLKGFPIPFLDAIITLLFIYLYSRFLKLMN
ncbi:MAG TPA: hypothetical protein PLI65_04635 [Bacteroidales bacterium]|nr:hypothetical protein [Bacteroidales bacterium]HPR58473.1 hypothetical protein [Bacteroidales bacterium]HRW96036.1 hypothetical protein [Bacteroidales bacterium]